MIPFPDRKHIKQWFKELKVGMNYVRMKKDDDSYFTKETMLRWVCKSIDAKSPKRKPAAALCNPFTDRFTGAGAEAHAASPVTGCNDQSRTAGNRTDNGKIVRTDGSKSCEKPDPAEPGENGNVVGKYAGVSSHLFKGNSGVESDKFSVAADVKISTGGLLYIEMIGKKQDHTCHGWTSLGDHYLSSGR